VWFRAGRRIADDREQWWVLVDGAAGKSHDWIGALGVSPDGERLAYWTQPGARVARDGSYRGGALVLVVGGKPGARFEDARALIPPVFSDDGLRVATIVTKSGRSHVLMVGRRGEKIVSPGHGAVTAVAVPAKGSRIAYAASRAASRAAPTPGGMFPGVRTVVHFGKTVFGESHDAAGVPVFSPDGRHVAMKVRSGGKMGVIVDGGKGVKAEYAFVSTPIFAPSGRRLAYAANVGGSISEFFALEPQADAQGATGGKVRLVSHDLRGRKRLVGPPADAIGAIVWSPDEKSIAHAVRTGKSWRMVVGEEQGEPFDEVGSPLFSEDGKRVAFGARLGRKLLWRVLSLE
jgi:hypothetical protein